MRKLTLMLFVFVVAAFGQSEATDLRTASGCGPATMRFDVKVDSKQHALTQPEAGKALVYVIQQGRPLGADIAVTTRIGLEGNWVGANHGESLLQFIDVIRGDMHVTFEEGTWAAWLYDLLKPRVTTVVVCNPRKNAATCDRLNFTEVGSSGL